MVKPKCNRCSRKAALSMGRRTLARARASVHAAVLCSTMSPVRPGTLAAVLMAALTAFAASAEPPEQVAKREPDGWSVEPSLYLFLPGMTGTVGIGSIDIDLDEPSDAV